MTVEFQRARGADEARLDALAQELNRAPLLRPFVRSTGSRLAGVTENPRLVVALTLDLVRRGGWRVGIGAGDVQRPLPGGAGEGRGRAFDGARRAAHAARGRTVPLAVVGPDPATTESAQAALELTGLIVLRRSAQGHSAVGLMDRGLSQAEAAGVLGISKQAMSQRLTTAAWQTETAGRRLCHRMLHAADRPDGGAAY